MTARLDLTPAEKRDHDRRLAAARKRRERARRGTDAIRRQTKAESASCADWDVLKRHIRKENETGCWVWRGPYTSQWEGLRPVVRRGQYGMMYADVAVFLVHTGRREIPRGAHLKRACGKCSCVSPYCAIPSNRIVEATKAELAKLTKEKRHGKQGKQQQVRQQRQLSRVG